MSPKMTEGSPQWTAAIVSAESPPWTAILSKDDLAGHSDIARAGAGAGAGSVSPDMIAASDSLGLCPLPHDPARPSVPAPSI